MVRRHPLSITHAGQITSLVGQLVEELNFLIDLFCIEVFQRFCKRHSKGGFPIWIFSFFIWADAVIAFMGQDINDAQLANISNGVIEDIDLLGDVISQIAGNLLLEFHVMFYRIFDYQLQRRHKGHLCMLLHKDFGRVPILVQIQGIHIVVYVTCCRQRTDKVIIVIGHIVDKITCSTGCVLGGTKFQLNGIIGAYLDCSIIDDNCRLTGSLIIVHRRNRRICNLIAIPVRIRHFFFIFPGIFITGRKKCNGFNIFYFFQVSVRNIIIMSNSRKFRPNQIIKSGIFLIFDNLRLTDIGIHRWVQWGYRKICWLATKAHIFPFNRIITII